MNKTSIEQAKDRDIAGSISAIRRAAKRANQVAAQTGTSLIVWHDGQIERVKATVPDAAAINTGAKAK